MPMAAPRTLVGNNSFRRGPIISGPIAFSTEKKAKARAAAEPIAREPERDVPDHRTQLVGVEEAGRLGARQSAYAGKVGRQPDGLETSRPPCWPS